jgi:predicted RNase H-like nuclease (RuvC/YqgF family)
MNDKVPIESILETMRELDKWKKRREMLERELKATDKQIAYYESMIAEMKSKISPDKLTDILERL